MKLPNPWVTTWSCRVLTPRQVLGDKISTFEMAEKFEKVYGEKPKLTNMGTKEGLKRNLDEKLRTQLDNPYAWMAEYTPPPPLPLPNPRIEAWRRPVTKTDVYQCLHVLDRGGEGRRAQAVA